MSGKNIGKFFFTDQIYTINQIDGKLSTLELKTSNQIDSRLSALELRTFQNLDEARAFALSAGNGQPCVVSGDMYLTKDGDVSKSITEKMLPKQLGKVFNVMDFGAVAEGNMYFRDGQYLTLDDLCENRGYDIKDLDKNDADEAHLVRRLVSELETHHDDTAAIQAAIDACAAAGGGCVYFPKPANRQRFYRLDAQPYEFYNQELNQPARKEWYLPANETREGRYANSPRADNASEWVRMQPLRAQLAIPPGTNVFLLGECPPVPLKHYHVLDGSENRNNFGFIDYGKTYEARCVVLRSSVDAPSNAGYQDRPWSVIAAPPGDVKANMRTASSSESFAMENLEIRVHIDCFGSSPNLYPTMGAVNAANVRRMYAVNCFFGLDNEVGSNYFTEDIT